MTTDISVFYAKSSSEPVVMKLAKASEAEALKKLAQRMILRLITPLGNAAGQPNFGSNFISELLSGRYRNESDVRSAFQEERLNILNQASNDEIGSDIRLADLQLVGVSLVGDSVSLRVNVISNTGSQAIFPILV